MNDGEHCRDQLIDLAMQPVDAPIPSDVRDHLAQCAECQAELVALREAWCLLPATLVAPKDDDARRSQRIEQQLMQRIAAANQAGLSPSRHLASSSISGRSRSLNLLRYVVAASVLAALIMFTTFAPRWFVADSGRLTPQEREQIDTLAKQMDELRRLESVFSSPDVRYVSMMSVELSSVDAKTRGYLVMDIESQEAHLLVSELPTMESASFHLWFLSSQNEVLASGPVASKSGGFGAATVRLPQDLARVAFARVTAETESHPPSPSEHVLLQATLQLD